MAVDLSEPLRTALVGAASVTTNLAAYKGSFPVFTRVPVPDDIAYPIVVVGTEVQAAEEDGLTDQRPTLTRDILVYGKNEPAADYRTVETIAFAIHALFNRTRTAITVTNWSVVDIIADSPSPAPVDDEQTVGRRVTLTIRLAKQN